MTLPNPLRIIHGGLGDDPLPGAGTEPESGSAPATAVPEPVAGAGNPGARGWLSAAAGSRHLGGGPHGLAAFLAHPDPEPLETHFRHAGNAVRAALDLDPDGGHRGVAAGKAAYHILVAIPLKVVAKILRRAAEFLDSAPDAPHVLILAVVAIGVIAAVFLLG